MALVASMMTEQGLLAGCSSKADPPSTKSATAVSAQAASSSSSAVDAVDQCIRTIVGVGQDRCHRAGAGAKVISECAPMYGDASCREGFTRAGTAEMSPADRIQSFVEPCVAAYCPRLPAPRPSICALTPEAVRSMPMREKSSAWSELNMTIVAQEHGTEAAIKLAQAPSEKDERTHVDVSTTGDRIDVTVHGATGFDTRHLDTPESERAFQSDLQSPKTPSAVVLEPSKSTTPAR